jgi:hypothetical protein
VPGVNNRVPTEMLLLRLLSARRSWRPDSSRKGGCRQALVADSPVPTVGTGTSAVCPCPDEYYAASAIISGGGEPLEVDLTLWKDVSLDLSASLNVGNDR